MKSPTKLSRMTQKNKLNLELDWEKISSLETSLRKLLNTQPHLTVNQTTIETLIKSAKQILRVIDIVRAQEKNFVSLQENYNLMQSKLNNHENIVNNLEKLHLERLKVIGDENKMAREHFEKAKKSLLESEELAKNQLMEIKKENSQLRFKVEVLVKEKEELLKMQEAKQKQIRILQDQQQRYKHLLLNQKQLPAPRYPEQSQNSTYFQQILCSNLGPTIIQYLNPQDVCHLHKLSKKTYFFIMKSKACQIATYKSILGFKNYIIKYYHKHINYFQKIYMKIPEEILQLAFYRYQIIKENIGVEILQTLNRSAMLFEGKFVEEGQDAEIEQKEQQIDTEIQKELIMKELERVQEYNQNARQSIEDMAGLEDNGKRFKKIQNQIHTILEIDPEIVKEYLFEQKSQKIKMQRDINLMYKKIQDTAQLYSADVESIGLFLKNILKNFSKVFVLSKNLYTECRNLQSLNTFVLKELSSWQKIQVKYTSQIEDLKAQLEAESRLKLFFSQKCLKSEQKALNQENIKLTIQNKYNKQTQKLDQICREKEEIKTKLEASQKNLKHLHNENKEVKKAYEHCRQKYKKIIQELSVVKETILRMNIM